MHFLKDFRYALCFGFAFGLGAAVGVMAIALGVQLVVGLTS